MELIECTGYKLKELYIPPFSLRMGEYITLVFPSPYDERVYNKVKELFLVEREFPTLKVYQHFSFLEKKSVGKPFFSAFTVKDFLIKNSNYNLIEINSIADELGISVKDSISSLGGNIIKILSIKAVYSKNKFIITDTSGLDYMGVEQVYSLLQNILQNGAIIEMKYPTYNDTSNFIPSKIVNLEIV